MAGIGDLSPDAVDIPDGDLHEALVNDNATAASDLVRCVEPEQGSLLATDPMQWTPYTTTDGVFYPKRGDRAIVSHHQGGPGVIVAWWPAEGAEPDSRDVVAAASGDLPLSGSETLAIPGCKVTVAVAGTFTVTAVFDFLCEALGGAATGRIFIAGAEQPRQGVFAPQIVNGRGDALAFAVAPGLAAGAVIELRVRSTGGTYKALAPHTSLLVSPAG